MGYFQGPCNNQPNEVIGVGMSKFILLGIYIALLNIYVSINAKIYSYQ